MKIDYELVRAMLVVAEENLDGFHYYDSGKLSEWFPNVASDKLWYHKKYLCDCEYLDHNDGYWFRDITPKGREFLASTYDIDIWDKVKQEALKNPFVTIKMLTELASYLWKLKLYSGL